MEWTSRDDSGVLFTKKVINIKQGITIFLFLGDIHNVYYIQSREAIYRLLTVFKLLFKQISPKKEAMCNRRQMELVNILFIFFATLQSVIRTTAPQLATMGTSFRLVEGEEIDNLQLLIERSIVFHRCSAEQACSHVGQLNDGGKFLEIRDDPKGEPFIAASWRKETEGKTMPFLNYLKLINGVIG